MKKIKKYLLLLIFFNIIALYTNTILAQHGCPKNFGGNHSTPHSKAYYFNKYLGWTKGIHLGGGGGGEDDYDYGDDDYGDDSDYGGDNVDDDGPDGLDWESFNPYHWISSCNKKALFVLGSATTWEEYAKQMYQYSNDKNWENFSFTGPITQAQKYIFSKNPSYLCNPKFLEDFAIPAANITEKCGKVYGYEEFSKIVDFIRDPLEPQNAGWESMVNCYFKNTIGKDFADCVLPTGQAADPARLKNALAIDEYLKKNPQDKAWLEKNGCELVNPVNSDCPNIKPNYQNVEEVSVISQFLKSHSQDAKSKSLAQSIATAFSSLTNEEKAAFNELSNYFKTHDPTDPLWEIMQEQFLDILKGFIADLIPGGTAVLQGPALVQAMQTGDWLNAFYIAADIAINEADNFNPIAKSCSIIIGSTQAYK